MSKKELAIELINRIPEYKLGYVIAYLQGLSADENEDEEDDDFCQALLKSCQSDSDKKEFVPFDEAVRMCGVDLNAIQNNN